MPTPIGHACGGLLAGCLAARVLARRRGPDPPPAGEGPPWWRTPAGLAAVGVLGMLPDLDLLAGTHRGVTHSLGATVVAGLAAAAIGSRGRGPVAVPPGPYGVVAVAVVAAAAYGSHVLLDWLATDPSAPRGVMALWPFTREHYVSHVQVFRRVCREYWLAACWGNNLLALGWELLLLLPPLAWVLRRPR